MLSTANDETTVSTKYPLTDIDQQPIKVGDSPAHMDGALCEIKACFVRNGWFKEFFLHRASLLSSGKLAITDLSTVLFLTGAATGPVHDFDNPCPLPAARLAACNAARAALVPPQPALVAATNLAPDQIQSIVLSEFSVDKLSQDLCTCLLSVFKNTATAGRILERVGCDGLLVLEAMKAIRLKTKPKDRLFVITTADEFYRAGLVGPVTWSTYQEHMKQFNRLQRTLALRDRKEEEQVMQMIFSIFHADVAVRAPFELLCTVKPPSDLAELNDTAEEFLRDRETSQAIDAIKSGNASKSTALVAAASRKASKAPVSATFEIAVAERDVRTLDALLAAGTITPAQLAHALVAAADPAKDARFKVPRDADGRVSSWVTGMPSCNLCGAKGSKGNHLHRNCPNPKDRPPPKKPKGGNESPKPTEQKGLIISNVGELSGADLAGELHSFFDHAEASHEVASHAAFVVNSVTQSWEEGTPVERSLFTGTVAAPPSPPPWSPPPSPPPSRPHSVGSSSGFDVRDAHGSSPLAQLAWGGKLTEQPLPESDAPATAITFTNVPSAAIHHSVGSLGSSATAFTDDLSPAAEFDAAQYSDEMAALLARQHELMTQRAAAVELGRDAATLAKKEGGWIGSSTPPPASSVVTTSTHGKAAIAEAANISLALHRSSQDIASENDSAAVELAMLRSRESLSQAEVDAAIKTRADIALRNSIEESAKIEAIRQVEQDKASTELETALRISVVEQGRLKAQLDAEIAKAERDSLAQEESIRCERESRVQLIDRLVAERVEAELKLRRSPDEPLPSDSLDWSDVSSDQYTTMRFKSFDRLGNGSIICRFTNYGTPAHRADSAGDTMMFKDHRTHENGDISVRVPSLFIERIRAAEQALLGPPPPLVPSTYTECQLVECDRPCYVEENGHTHEFCSKRHADKFARLSSGSGPPHECCLATCQRPCWVENDGTVLNFCGVSHAREYKRTNPPSYAQEYKEIREHAPSPPPSPSTRHDDAQTRAASSRMKSNAANVVKPDTRHVDSDSELRHKCFNYPVSSPLYIAFHCLRTNAWHVTPKQRAAAAALRRRSAARQSGVWAREWLAEPSEAEGAWLSNSEEAPDEPDSPVVPVGSRVPAESQPPLSQLRSQHSSARPVPVFDFGTGGGVKGAEPGSRGYPKRPAKGRPPAGASVRLPATAPSCPDFVPSCKGQCVESPLLPDSGCDYSISSAAFTLRGNSVPIDYAASLEPLVDRRTVHSCVSELLSRHQFAIFLTLCTVCLISVVIAATMIAAPAALLASPLAQPGVLTNSLGSAPEVDPNIRHHSALVVSIYEGSTWSVGIRPMSAIWFCCALFLSFTWIMPVWTAYIAVRFPAASLMACAFVSCVPVVGLLNALRPSCFAQVNASLGGRLVSRPVESLNRLRHYLPLSVKCAVLWTVLLIGTTSTPVEPAHAAAAAAEYDHAVDVSSIKSIDLPYLGAWLPQASSQVEAGSPLYHALPVTAAQGGNKLKLNSKLPFFSAHPDSGASASLTDQGSRLINRRACNEVFGQANGLLTQCLSIGDLPVITRDSEGQLIRLTFTNVREIPEYKFTLLSVTQMWKEQNIDARFKDLNHLQLPDSAGSHTIEYDKKILLSTLILVSEAELNLTDLGRQFASKVNAVAPTSAESAPSSTAAPEQALAALGFHAPSSVSHIARLSSAQAGEIFHRRNHSSHFKTRQLPDTCSDAPKNLSSAPLFNCPQCAISMIKKAPHPGRLDTPQVDGPGDLHIDLKCGLPESIGGYKYALFATDEYSRYVFVRFLKTKDEADEATKLVIAEFNSIVGTPLDENGKPLARPTVRSIRRDHEGALESKRFDVFRADSLLHSTESPPHDHDVNGIAERCIGVIMERANASRIFCKAPVGFWPYLIQDTVNKHNAMSGSVGSSTADANVSAFQRLTLRQPRIIDLCTFGCRAVVLKPAQHQTNNAELTGRGWAGCYLGRGHSVGSHRVWANNRIVESSSVLCDEETFPWCGAEASKPLTPTARPALPSAEALKPDIPPPKPTANDSHTLPHAAVNASDQTKLCLLSMFSGDLHRTQGLPDQLRSFGWADVVQIDNSSKVGGGWVHDIMNDSLYTQIKTDAAAGRYDAIMIAFPCTTFSVARFFDASRDDSSKDPGPPPVRTIDSPDGLNESSTPAIAPKYLKELRYTNRLLDRVINICILARASPKKTTLVFEQPAKCSVEGTNPYSEHLSQHSTLYDTSFFKRLTDISGPSSFCTFAACRFLGDYQKYTTLWYTNEAAGVLDQLNGADYQCNHAEHKKRAGGHLPDGRWASEDAAAYPDLLNVRLAMAFTAARTGSIKPLQRAAIKDTVAERDARPPPAEPVADAPEPLNRAPATEHRAAPHTPASAPATAPALSPAYVDFVPFSSPPAPPHVPFQPTPASGVNLENQLRAVARSPASPQVDEHTYSHDSSGNRLYEPNLQAYVPPEQRKYPLQDRAARATRGSTRAQRLDDFALPEDPVARSAHVAEQAVAELIFDTHVSSTSPDEVCTPMSAWEPIAALTAQKISQDAQLLADGSWMIDASSDSARSIVANTPRMRSALLAAATSGGLDVDLHRALFSALRADSEGAPTTSKQADEMGGAWPGAKRTELDNHARNGSWELVTCLPKGRRAHKLVWVFKEKRDGTCKAARRYRMARNGSLVAVQLCL